MEEEKTASKATISSYFTGFLNRLGGTLLDPGKTFEQIIAEKRGFLEPLLIVFLSHGIQGAIIGSFIVRIILAIYALLGEWIGEAPSGLIVSIPIITFFVAFVGTLILWVILAGIAHLCAKYIFKGAGSFGQLLKLYGYASVPYSLIILATVLIGVNFTLSPLSLILGLTAIFWMVLIMVVAVDTTYKIGSGKAFISSFVGPMIVLLILFIALWLILLGIAAMFGGVAT
jgi:hypothetical protein